MRPIPLKKRPFRFVVDGRQFHDALAKLMNFADAKSRDPVIFWTWKGKLALVRAGAEVRLDCEGIVQGEVVLAAKSVRALLQWDRPQPGSTTGVYEGHGELKVLGRRYPVARHERGFTSFADPDESPVDAIEPTASGAETRNDALEPVSAAASEEQPQCDLSLMGILRLANTVAAEELAFRGLGEIVQAAVRERDLRIKRAADALEPLGITSAELLSLLERR